MNEPAAVDSAECGRQGDCESEKSCDLHGLADKAIEGLAICVLDNQHRLTRGRQRTQCERTVQVLPKFEFVCEAIDALTDRMLRAGKGGYKRVPPAISIIPPQSAECTSRISPQHV
jgi:hypothetical protein